MKEWDFLFTQMVIDERIERTKDIREEVDRLVNDEVTREGEEWEKLRFHGESSDMHSSERGSPLPKKNLKFIKLLNNNTQTYTK